MSAKTCLVQPVGAVSTRGVGLDPWFEEDRIQENIGKATTNRQ